MSAITFTHQDLRADAKLHSTRLHARTKALAAGAVAGLAGGMTTALLGHWPAGWWPMKGQATG